MFSLEGGILWQRKLCTRRNRVQNDAWIKQLSYIKFYVKITTHSQWKPSVKHDMKVMFHIFF